MASENNFQSTVESLFKGMDSFITTKTVVVPDFLNKFTDGKKSEVILSEEDEKTEEKAEEK